MNFQFGAPVFISAVAASVATAVALFSFFKTIKRAGPEKFLFLTTAMVAMYFAVFYLFALFGTVEASLLGSQYLRPAAPGLFSLVSVYTFELYDRIQREAGRVVAHRVDDINKQIDELSKFLETRAVVDIE